MKHDLIVRGGTVVDPVNGRCGRLDLALRAGRIVAAEPDLGDAVAARVFSAAGRLVLPGLVDTHVHLSGHPEGQRMLVRAGVTTALDLAGRAEPLFHDLLSAGTGLTIGFVYPLIPGDTLSGADPGAAEIRVRIEAALDQGALGVKILGGHYPLTPAATARVIAAAHRAGAWCAVHAGTTATGSNIEGLEELLQLADGLPVHVAHINSYCRGQVTGDPLLEASRALAALRRAPQVRSESYLARINATNGRLEGGTPRSHATRTCLEMGGFAATAKGVDDAIAAGWAKVNWARHGETVLLGPREGLAQYHANAGNVWLSFPVNSAAAAIGLATAKADGRFTVTALSTDGGAIPRNVTLEKGLALVRFGALTLAEFVEKAAAMPARMLGLKDRGHLGVGAAADLLVVDRDTARLDLVLGQGRILVQGGKLRGTGGTLISTSRGRERVAAAGVAVVEAAPDWLGPEPSRGHAHGAIVKTVTSGRAKSLSGGPQVPVPGLT